MNRFGFKDVKVCGCIVCALLIGFPINAATRLAEKVCLDPGKYGGHLQDVTRDGDFLYWAHTRTILKTDLSGKVLASVKDPDYFSGSDPT